MPGMDSVQLAVMHELVMFLVATIPVNNLQPASCTEDLHNQTIEELSQRRSFLPSLAFPAQCVGEPFQDCITSLLTWIIHTSCSYTRRKRANSSLLWCWFLSTTCPSKFPSLAIFPHCIHKAKKLKLHRSVAFLAWNRANQNGNSVPVYIPACPSWNHVRTAKQILVNWYKTTAGTRPTPLVQFQNSWCATT